MKQYFQAIFLLLTNSLLYVTYGQELSAMDLRVKQVSVMDSIANHQILYNGRSWKNMYYKVKEDQFLFSNEFLPASLAISGQFFDIQDIKYDIFNDEIIIPNYNGAIIQVNKEMVDSFSIFYHDLEYKFVNMFDEPVRGFTGYVNIIYSGNSSLYIKHKKEIKLLAVEGRFDSFYETQKVFIRIDTLAHQVSGKRELFNYFGDYKNEVKSFTKKNKIRMTIKNPMTIIPIITYFDSIRQ